MKTTGGQRELQGVHQHARSALLNKGGLATSANSETHPAQMFPGFALTANRAILTELVLKSLPQKKPHAWIFLAAATAV